MAHCQKIKLCDAKRVLDEIARSADHYKNDVNPELSDLNYVLSPVWKSTETRVRNLKENSHITGGLLTSNLNHRLSDLKYRAQKNTVGLCNWVVSCPEPLKGDPAAQERFFKVVYSYTLERYGSDNVLFGVVHNDETNPHLHIPVIPVVKENHLCARDFLTRRELAGYQRDLEDVCEREFGMKGLILNGRTKGNYTLDELKQRTKDEEDIQNKKQQAAELERAAREHEQQARLLVEHLRSVNEQFGELVKEMDEEQQAKRKAQRAKLTACANGYIQDYNQGNKQKDDSASL